MDDSVELLLIHNSLTQQLYELIDSNRGLLREWLPWVETTLSPEDTRKFVDFAVDQYAQKTGAHYGIFVSGSLCGMCGLYNVMPTTRVGEVGYWLAESYYGKGIMTTAVRMLIDKGFTEHGLNRIEIICATGNRKSRAVPERLNMQCEAILRQRILVNHQFHDAAMYSILKEELDIGPESLDQEQCKIQFVLSTDYEAAVSDTKSEMLPYYVQHNLEWNDALKLQRYQESTLLKIVADADVGFIMFYEKDELFYIVELFIKPQFRSKGYGSAAIMHVRSIAMEKGYGEIRIGVFKTSPAFYLYKKLAFELEEEGPYTYQLLMKIPQPVVS
jgi:ribosomal-protein-serine acetyltransferase